MTTLKDIRQIIIDYIEDESIDDIFDSYINWAVRFVENEKLWSVLYRTKDITTDSTGVILLPPLCGRLLEVYPSVTTGFPSYKFMPMVETENKDTGYLIQNTYRPYEATLTDEAEYTCSVTNGTNTITEVAGKDFFTSDDVGKMIIVSGDSNPYEILSFTDDTFDTITVYPEMSAPTSTQTSIILGPAGMQRIILKDSNNAPYEGDVTIAYQMKHPKLFEDDSRLLIPCPLTVAYKTLMFALETNKYAVDANRLAQNYMLALNSEFGVDPLNRTRNARKDGLFRVRQR